MRLDNSPFIHSGLHLRPTPLPRSEQTTINTTWHSAVSIPPTSPTHRMSTNTAKRQLVDPSTRLRPILIPHYGINIDIRRTSSTSGRNIRPIIIRSTECIVWRRSGSDGGECVWWEFVWEDGGRRSAGAGCCEVSWERSHRGGGGRGETLRMWGDGYVEYGEGGVSCCVGYDLRTWSTSRREETRDACRVGRPESRRPVGSM